MKLKYYLRGVGIGIIFATLIMTLSSVVHKYNISDEYIIKEAMKLGMVMKEDLEDEDVLGDAVTELEESTQVAENDVVETENVSASEIPSESDAPDEQDVPVESETPVEPETPVESQNSEEVQASEGNQNAEYVTIVIERGDYARQVAEKLYAAGLVADAEEFRVYIGNNGYGHSIHVGTFQIPVGATYEEICKIITS